MRTRPNLVDFPDNVVIEEHIAVILDGLHVDVEDVSEIQFRDFAADAAEIAAGQGVDAHSDFNEKANLHVEQILACDVFVSA